MIVSIHVNTFSHDNSLQLVFGVSFNHVSSIGNISLYVSGEQKRIQGFAIVGDIVLKFVSSDVCFQKNSVPDRIASNQNVLGICKIVFFEKYCCCVSTELIIKDTVNQVVSGSENHCHVTIFIFHVRKINESQNIIDALDGSSIL